MKRIFLLLLLVSQLSVAQEQSAMLGRPNEFRIDALSLIAQGKWNLTYERFFNGDISAGVTGSYANSDKITEDYEAGFRNNQPKYEIVPFVRYNMSKSQTNFYFVEIFVAANGGSAREITRVETGANAHYEIAESDYFDVAIGGSRGYKIYFKEKYGVEFLVGFGPNLIDKDKSPDVISRVGLNFGYRF